MAQILKAADMRDLEAHIGQGEITYSRMLELIEERVLEGYISKEVVLKELDKITENAYRCQNLSLTLEAGLAKYYAGIITTCSSFKHWILNQK
jgi:hypothetical protein